jgi:TolB protein
VALALPHISLLTCVLSNDGRHLSYQAIPAGTTHPCDQIFEMNPDGSNVTAISPLNGRTTCSYVLNDGRILYSSTMVTGRSTASHRCPPTPDPSAGYLWPIYRDMQIYIGRKGGVIDQTLAVSGFYDAESTLSPDGQSIVFTSARDGDLELYTVRLDGTQLQRMTVREVVFLLRQNSDFRSSILPDTTAERTTATMARCCAGAPIGPRDSS